MTLIQPRPRVVGLLGLIAACAWSAAALAAVDVDFGASVPIGDSGQLFLAISSRYFDRAPELVRGWYGECRDPDDLAVALFVAGRCGQDPGALFRLRHQGLSWWEIGARFGVPVDAWFVPLDHNPGPPYGHAYGYWRKWRHNHRYRFRLSDREIRDLIVFRMLHEYYGVRPVEAMQWRAVNRHLPTVMSREYFRRHPHAEMRGGPPERGRRHDGYQQPGRGGHDRGRGPGGHRGR